MGWNHRIMAHEHEGEIYLEVHDVYYNDAGVPNACTDKGITVGADTMEGIQWVLEKIEECASKPILWYGEKFPEEYKEV